MAEYIIQEETLKSIANAVRTKTGKTSLLTLDDMAAEIAEIETGITTDDATAVAGDILSDKTAYVKDVKVTGTMPNLSKKTSITFTPTNYTPVIPGDAIFKQTNTDNVDRILIRYNGEAGYLRSNTLFGYDSAMFGNATSNQVAKGATFTSKNGISITGSYEGIELNFSVVGGTTAPTNPTENMIWVNTDVAITGWIFSATQPASSNGMIWFQISTFSSAEFNALKQNSIQVYPTITKQYIGDVWVEKTAKCYQGGKWVEIEPYQYIFKQGRGSDSEFISKPYWKYQSDMTAERIYCNAPASTESDGASGLVDSYDFTNYSQLVFDLLSNNSAFTCGYLNTFVNSYNQGFVGSVSPPTGSRTTVRIDISGVTGKKYIGFKIGNRAAGAVEIYNIYLKP